MMVEATVALMAVWGLHRLVHLAILRGLRAPRLPHTPAGPGVAADGAQQVWIASAGGKRLFGWLVAAPRAVQRPAPAGMAEKRVPYPLLRHVQQVIGASFDDIAPLNTMARVRCPILLVHGRDDATVPASDAKRLLTVSAQARLLLVDGDHDLRDCLAAHTPVLVDFLHAACVVPGAVVQAVAGGET